MTVRTPRSLHLGHVSAIVSMFVLSPVPVDRGRHGVFFKTALVAGPIVAIALLERAEHDEPNVPSAAPDGRSACWVPARTTPGEAPGDMPPNRGRAALSDPFP